MHDEQDRSHKGPPAGYRGPAGLGETLARAVEQNLRADRGSAKIAEGAFLRQFAETHGCLISETEWSRHRLVSNDSAEHEVRFCEAPRTALKRTHPGTFGQVPRYLNQVWEPRPPTLSEYLHRLHLQNELFGDEIRLIGIIKSMGPSLLISPPPHQFSTVISQPWLEPLSIKEQFPSESEIYEYLRDLGFVPLLGTFFGWEHHADRIVVLDARLQNFIRTPDDILPIDLLLAEYSLINHQPDLS